MTFKYSLLLVFLLVSITLTGCDDSSTSSGPYFGDGPIPLKNLEAAWEYVMKSEDGDPIGMATVIWHDDEILLEGYARNFDGQQLHTLFSGSKSFAGMLAAIAVKNGLFTFDTPLGELIPDWDPESERGKVTIRQLLSLSSGIKTASAGTNQTAAEWLAADMEFERGSTFVYGPTPFYILSWIFVEVLNINPIDYLEEHLFNPLGVVRGNWFITDGKYPNFAYGANYPALDWLQIGIMLKNHGTMNGSEIIPGDLLDQLVTPSEANPGYGITFWLNTPIGQQKRSAMDIPGLSKSQVTTKIISDIMPDDLFMMSGLFGQKLYICPSLNLVIVRYGVIVVGDISDEEFFSRLMNGVNQTTLQ